MKLIIWDSYFCWKEDIHIDYWLFVLSGEVKSVYVRNLPSTVTAFEIEEEFQNFGRIKPDGVFVRNRKVTPPPLAPFLFS